MILTKYQYTKSRSADNSWFRLLTIILIQLFSTGSFTKGQNIDMGTGIVKVGMYSFAEEDTPLFDSAHLFQSYTFFINKNKVLRKEDSLLKNSDETVSSQGISTMLTSEILMPTYYLDLKEKQSYLIYIDDADMYYVNRSPLESFTIDIFYRQLEKLSHEQPEHKLDKGKESHSHKSSGKSSIVVLPKNSNDSVRLEYVTEKWPVISPLNIYLPSEMSGVNVTKATTMVDGTGKNGEKVKYQLTFKIEYVKDTHINKEIFELPTNAIYLDTKNEILQKYMSNN